MRNASMSMSQGELKRRLAMRLGSDPTRYDDALGTERHKRLTTSEIDALCAALGLGFLADESKQEQMDAVMLKLDRDHRTGASMWDSSDLVAVLSAIESAGSVEEVPADD